MPIIVFTKNIWLQKSTLMQIIRRVYMKKIVLIGFPVLLMLIFLVSPSIRATAKIPVFVSILPQKYFVKKIGGDLVDVDVMVFPGASPHTFEPKPRQMVALAKAKLYFAIDVEFEHVWLKKFSASNPIMRVVRMDQGIEKMPMTAYHHEGDGDEHQQGIPDPHIWLSPSLVKKQAKTILEALEKLDSSHQKQYRLNYHRFMNEISELDLDLRKTFHGKEGLQFIVFHPSWGYFARDYHLKQVPIEIEGKNPKPAQLRELIRHARAQDIRVIFVQPQFSQRNARLIAKEIKGEVVRIDPLVEDWGDNMRTVASKFKNALK